jgi:hypothetical protein
MNQKVVLVQTSDDGSRTQYFNLDLDFEPEAEG